MLRGSWCFVALLFFSMIEFWRSDRHFRVWWVNNNAYQYKVKYFGPVQDEVPNGVTAGLESPRSL